MHTLSSKGSPASALPRHHATQMEQRFDAQKANYWAFIAKWQDKATTVPAKSKSTKEKSNDTSGKS
jgi:hypothetical protein